MSKYKLLELDNNGIINLIAELDKKVSQEQGHSEHAERNFNRIAESWAKQENFLTERYKKKLFDFCPALDSILNKIHGNSNSKVYNKYEGTETDLTFWEWATLRDYVTYKEVLEDYWQLIEYRIRDRIKEGKLQDVINGVLI